MAKQNKMTDEELISLIDQHITDSVYYGDENAVVKRPFWKYSFPSWVVKK